MTLAATAPVLPILHLNGYKIANPAVKVRISPSELDELLRGYGYSPRYVEGRRPATMHQAMAAVLDTVLAAPAGFVSVVNGRGAWLRSYRPEELFDADGKPTGRVTALIPRGERRMGASPCWLDVASQWGG